MPYKRPIRTYELGGMPDEKSLLGRPFDVDFVLRPDRVALDKGRGMLVFDTKVPVMDPPRPRLLDEFLGLREPSDSDIEAFAAKYGVLSVEPFRKGELGVFEEPLSLWRDYLSRARASLAVAAKLHLYEPGNQDDWKRLRPWWRPEWADVFAGHKDLTQKEAQLAIQRHWCVDVMTTWLELVELRPCFRWRRTTQGVGFTNLQGVDEGSVTMSGALALQLVAAASAASKIAVCSGCGLPYRRRWHSTTGRRNFCEECGRKGATQQASAAYRARQAEKRKAKESDKRKQSKAGKRKQRRLPHSTRLSSFGR